MVLDHLAQQGIAFSQAQQAAIAPDPAPTLLLAVPGSGKTTVLVTRAASMLESGSPAGRICCLSYSRESAQDMAARFGRLFSGCFPESPGFSTIHSLCWRILNDFARQNRRPLPQLTGSGSAPASTRLLARCAKEVAGRFPDEEGLRELAAKTGLCKNRMLSPAEIANLSGIPAYFPDVFARYEAVKKAAGLMDYDDMLLYTLNIFEKRPLFRQYWQGCFDFWNIDEAQDLSPAQWALLKALSPRGQGLFLVGDEDQSIYAFRGGDPKGLLRFPEDFPGAKVLKMEENRRSRPEILQLCNAFIRLNPDRYAKTLRSLREPGGTVERVSPKSQEDSYQKAAKILLGQPGSTAGLLYRNNLTAWGLSVFLREKGIPFRLNGGGIRLLKGRSGTMAALLRLCADPFDLEAFQQLDYRPDLDQTLFQNVLLRADGKKSVPALLLEAAPLSPRGGSARNMAEVLEACACLPPGKALAMLEDRLALGRRLRAGRDRGEAMPRLAYAQLSWFCRTSQDYAALFARLEEPISAFRPAEALVTLSTIHSAKGREFDTVLLLDCFDGILPGLSALEAEKSEDPGPYREELRLFYVGATRARDRLFLFDPPKDQPGFRLSRLGYTFLLPPPVLLEAKVGFRNGEALLHQSFGRVIVENSEGDRLFLRCSSGILKTVSISYCISHNLLHSIPWDYAE